MKSFRLEKEERDEDGNRKSFRVDRVRSSPLWKATDGLTDEDTRERLIRRAQNKARRLTPGSRGMAIGLVIYVAMTLILAAVIGQKAAPLAVVGLLGIIVITYFDNRGVEERELRHLSLMLVDEGIRPIVCLKCQYNLKGTVSGSCPECGEPLAPPREEQP